MACHFLFQGIFLTQGSNPSLLCLLHCRQILYHCITWEAQCIVQWGLNNLLEIVGRIKDVVEVPGVGARTDGDREASWLLQKAWLRRQQDGPTMVEANLGEAHSPDYIKLSLCASDESCSTKHFLGLIVCLVTVSSRGEDLSKIERQNSAACTIFVFHAIIS